VTSFSKDGAHFFPPFSFSPGSLWVAFLSLFAFGSVKKKDFPLASQKRHF
jgi:hypothetical protein